MGETHISVPENNNWLGSIMSVERTEAMSQQQGPRIPRVPQIFSGIGSNKKCYEPKVVSIGPYYHGKLDRLQEMEKSKCNMVRGFVQQSKKLIEDVYQTVVDVAEDARRYYVEDESVKLDDMTEFTRMMFLDGCFVIQFMYCLLRDHENLKMSSHAAALVTRDLLLLENQLPFLVLRSLMKLRFGSDEEGMKLIKDFIKHIRAMPRQRVSCRKKISKFFSKIFTRRAISNYSAEDPEMEEYHGASHLLELFHMHFVDKNAPLDDSTSRTSLYRYHPAKELSTVGIHFKPSKTSQFTDVQFKTTWLAGRVQIPPLTIDDSTRSILLNLVAYEACLGDNDKLWVTSYICFMDSLIDHPEDVRVLRSKGILLVTLGSEEEVAKLFNEVANYLVPNPRAFNKVKKDIESYFRSTIKRWVAEHVDTYFSSPWSFITLVAASLTIALTAIQSYFTLFPLNNNGDFGKY
jgi:siroheme synthase (precorrin-2 oxidase/ferrochelatase)